MKGMRHENCFVRLQTITIYLIGLTCTCFGVAMILKTGWGIDAWNGVFAGLAKRTPLSIGIWSVIIQGGFWTLASILNKKPDWLCILPILFKGVFLDVAKAGISFMSVPDGPMADSVLFLLGYILVAAGTGAYVATGYPKMPIDGLMMALADFFSWNVRNARLTIELSGFTLLLLVRGPFGIGTILITVTIGYVISHSCKIAQRLLFNDSKIKIRSVKKQKNK